MFNRIYKFLSDSDEARRVIEAIASLLGLIGIFVMGMLMGQGYNETKTNHCEQQIELVKQGAKQGVLEFLNEFGLEYRKKK